MPVNIKIPDLGATLDVNVPSSSPNDVSVRVGSKAFLYNPYVPEFRSRAFLIRPQLSVELAYTW